MTVPFAHRPLAHHPATPRSGDPYRWERLLALFLAALLAAALTALCLCPTVVRGQNRVLLPLLPQSRAPATAAPAPMTPAPITPDGADQRSRALLPLITRANHLVTTESYAVSYAEERTVTAFGGRVTIHVPAQSLPYGTCTLTAVTPNPQAVWLEVYVYTTCQVGYRTLYVSDLYRPITISLDYSRVDLTYLDELRLGLATTPSYDWAPEVDGWRPLPAADVSAAEVDPAAAHAWTVTVDTTAKRVTVATDHTYVVPRLTVGYTISDLARGPGSAVYAAAAPVIYSVGDGTMTRLANLETLPAAADLLPSFQRIAVNRGTGDIYLALAGKVAGSGLKIYALNGSSLRALYTVPAGEEVWVMAHRSQGNLLYVGMAKITDYWWGCPIREAWVRVIKADTGAVQGTVSLSYLGAARALDGLAVNSAGRVLATYSAVGACGGPGYDGSVLLTATSTAALPAFAPYPGFRGVDYVTGDDQGRAYLSNQSANLISVVSGADSEVVGYLPVAQPGPLAVGGGTLYVIAGGKLTTLPLSAIQSGGGDVTIVPNTLSGVPGKLRVTSPAFAPIPAHNVLYFNNARYFMTEEYTFTGQERELTYAFHVPQPTPGQYQPLTDQTAVVTFKLNGAQVAAKTLAAPETPYINWEYADYQTGPTITIARRRWARLSFTGALTSQENLFAPIPADGNLGRVVYIQFNQVGEFHFLNQRAGEADRLFTAIVTPYGAMGTTQQTLDAAQGGVLWLGGAALEIPAGALPSHSGGYTVTLKSQANTLTLHDTTSARSPIYTFSVLPEVLHLNRGLKFHLPRATGTPILAFYDPLLQDPYTIPSSSDPTSGEHLLLTLPAGDYPSSVLTELGYGSAADSLPDAQAATLPAFVPAPDAAAEDALPAAVDASWLRRGLNWLGQTGVWHAVGLPNDKIVTPRFVILFNTNDCTPAYAGTLLDALEDAYTEFSNQGAIMPSYPVYVKIATWAATTSTPGVTPGVSSLLYYYVFINAKLATAELQDTAVHEFMHVLQKTNALPDGRYMNPLWWEEATAVWAQYALYPDHQTYYNDLQDEGEGWLRQPYSNWNGMSTAQMYAAMALAEYLTQKHGDGAVFRTFQEMGIGLDGAADVAKAIEVVSGQKFDDFYDQFAQDYWLQTFEPVKSWTFPDALTGANAGNNAIQRVGINQPVNAVVNRGDLPALSSGLLKVHAIDPLPVSFTRDTGSTTGSSARIANSCTGNVFRFYDAQRKLIPGLTFNGEPALPDLSEALYDKNLGNLTLAQPVYVLYMDRSYKYSAACAPVLTLEQPTLTSLSPSSVRKNTTVGITAVGAGFGATPGQVAVAFSLLPADRVTSWTPTVVTFTWDTGSTPGTVTVQLYTKKGARSNGLTLTITP